MDQRVNIGRPEVRYLYITRSIGDIVREKQERERERERQTHLRREYRYSSVQFKWSFIISSACMSLTERTDNKWPREEE